MPKEQEDFIKAVDTILEVVMFENWLRFYFINEMYEEEETKKTDDNNPKLFIVIPEKGMHKIQELYPSLYPLAKSLNNQEITFEVSQGAVCSYIVENIDGTLIPRDTAPTMMDSIAFQVRLNLFNTWIQLHENQLEQGFLEFGTWKELFTEWKNSDVGRDLTEKLILAHQQHAPTVEQ